jgi:hypothetical protein
MRKANMTEAEIKELNDAIKQTDAIFALEGFEPTEQIHGIRAAVLAGRATYPQAIKKMCEYVTQNKTLDGFQV